MCYLPYCLRALIWSCMTAAVEHKSDILAAFIQHCVERSFASQWKRSHCTGRHYNSSCQQKPVFGKNVFMPILLFSPGRGHYNQHFPLSLCVWQKHTMRHFMVDVAIKQGPGLKVKGQEWSFDYSSSLMNGRNPRVESNRVASITSWDILTCIIVEHLSTMAETTQETVRRSYLCISQHDVLDDWHAPWLAIFYTYIVNLISTDLTVLLAWHQGAPHHLYCCGVQDLNLHPPWRSSRNCG